MNINSAIDLVIQYSRTGDFKKAGDICKKILKEDPNNTEALHLNGVIFSRIGKYDSAITYLRKALQIDPNFAEAYHTLGTVYYEKKEFNNAVQCLMIALRINPAIPKAWYHLGNILQDSGKLNEAVTAYQQALNLNIRDASILNNLGLVFQKKGQFDKSLMYYRKALDADPNCAEAYYNLGNVLREMNELDQAIAVYKKALQINPEYTEALNNLGLIFYKKGLFKDAENCYQNAVEINPKLFEVYNNLGNLLKDTGHAYEAASYYRKVLELNPGYAGAHNNLGTVLKDMGKIEEAEKYYRKAFQLEPESSYYSNILLLMNYSSHYDAKAVFHEHLQFARRFAEPLASALLPHANEGLPERRLRIGYISPDFRRHSVNYFIEPVLASHSHEQFEIFCYSDVIVSDTTTRRLRGYADQWHDVTGVGDEKTAELIRNDGIDMLVDLAGHTGYNRLLLFARKPAPIQISWIGYPNTTGLSTMDYRLVDIYTDPPGVTDPFYTENLIRLPGSFLCYLPEEESPEVGPLPFLTSGHITFGSFNNFAKETPEVIGLWAEILRRISGSRLILKARSFIEPQIREEVLAIFASYSIESHRIDLLSLEASFSGHLGLYNQIDIALDPFPYNGTTTTCEALWMGVPVITLAGNVHASRVGASLLSNLGIPDLITTTPDDYVRTAERLAGDTKRLRLLREELRDMMKHSTLTDARRFIVNLESFYRTAWEDWCKGN